MDEIQLIYFSAVNISVESKTLPLSLYSKDLIFPKSIMDSMSFFSW